MKAPPRAPAFRTVSFDLFDTVLVRPVLEPTDVFRLVEEELEIPGWAAARVKAERAARRGVPCGEANLDEIYAAEPLARFSGHLAQARVRELHWEAQSVVLPRAIEQIANARSTGADILFISDTYLPRPNIEALLRGVIQPGDHLFLSHEQRCGKGTGIWPQLAMRYNMPWRHYGDNPRADVKIPRSIGIEPVLVTDTQPNARERTLARDNPGNPLVAGCARLARLMAPHRTDDAWIDGANVVGPVFHTFTRWVMAEARRLRLDAIYFLARDGELPAAMAQLHPNQTIGVRYLMGSRHAFYNAAFDMRQATHREWVIHARPSSIRGVLANLKTTPEAIATWLAAAGFQSTDWDRPLSAVGCREFLTKLAATDGGDDWLRQRHALYTAPALTYFEQMGVFDHRRIALVDIGWSGTTLDSFRAILARSKRQPPEIVGLFFGLLRNAAPDRFCFAFAPQTWPHWAVGFPAVLETMLSAKHGQVTGFETDAAGTARPTCSATTSAAPHILSALHGGALCYAQLADALNNKLVHYNRLLRAAVETPSVAEAERWARFNFGSLQTADTTAPISLVPPLSTGQAIQVLCSPFRHMHDWPWPTAMLVRHWSACPNWALRALTLKYIGTRFIWNIGRAAWRRLKRLSSQSTATSRSR